MGVPSKIGRLTIYVGELTGMPIFHSPVILPYVLKTI